MGPSAVAALRMVKMGKGSERAKEAGRVKSAGRWPGLRNGLSVLSPGRCHDSRIATLA